MRNIINIIKFDIINKKAQLIIGSGIVLFFIMQLSIFWRWIPSEFIFIPIICVVLLVSLISTIVRFMKCISAEEGRLVFLVPIKGWEFLSAKYVGFILEGIWFIILTCLGCIITGGKISLLLITSVSVLWGFLILFLLVSTLSIIYKSYFNNNGICIVLVAISIIIFGGVTSILELISYVALPSIYLIIGEILEINLFNIFIDIIIFAGLLYMSVNHIDKKLDII